MTDVAVTGKMAEDGTTARRVRVERNIYRRASGVYEVGFRDAGGKQRWRTVAGGITAARAIRDELLARRGGGERVVTDGRLRFAEAAAKWLGGPVLDLRPTTRESYRNAIEQHVLPAFGTRCLDAISPDDLAHLVRELRTKRLSESTIVIALGVTSRVYRYAARRLGWTGANPVSLMLRPSGRSHRRASAGESSSDASSSKRSGRRESRIGRCSPLPLSPGRASLNCSR
jgi:integrase-like protein